MNKNIIAIAVMATLVVGTASPVLADNGNKPDRQPFGLEVKNERQSFRDSIASRSQQFRQMIQNKLAEVRKSRVANWWDKAVERLQKLINRETKLADKLQARLDRLAADGKDMIKPRAELTATRVAITNAQIALNDAKGQATDVITDNTLTEAAKKLHDLHRGVTDKIRQAHRQLAQAIIAIRSASNATILAPTPTATQ